jgi:hypothetical protein
VKIENSCVIFNKRYPHSSEIVTDGEKIIMTVDVLVHIPNTCCIKQIDLDKFKQNTHHIIMTHDYDEFKHYLNTFSQSSDIVPFITICGHNDYTPHNEEQEHQCTVFGIDDFDDMDEYRDKKESYITYKLQNVLGTILHDSEWDFSFEKTLENNFLQCILVLKKYSVNTLRLGVSQKEWISKQLRDRKFNDNSHTEQVSGSSWCNEEFDYQHYSVSILAGFAHEYVSYSE